MGTRRYDPEAAREDILTAAERLFAARGYGDVSTAAIAREAGVSQSQIHYHFDTKRKLWEAVFQRRFAEYFAVQSQLLERTDLEGTDRMENSIRAYFRFFQEHPGFIKLLVRAQLEEQDEHEPMSASLLGKGAEVIADAQRDGVIRDDVPAPFVLFGFLSLVSSWFQMRQAHLPDLGFGDPAESYDEAYLEFILKVFLQGIAPRQEG
ncbi:MAG: TetR/AcrR family transcriptional regulator [Deltaproteobacteria bacterium]|nr:TetR/AcrR family transcriptional regulator [Deltaproteobacteria bacterium]MBW2536163.1 TetR/AcrR family transcriptional regulator [Deltaproteobacteria bacterium]